jgi:hypothetical protein
MKKMILLAVVAAISLAAFALPAVPVGDRAPHHGPPALILAEGTTPFPMCGAKACTPGMITPAPVLADGSSPIPLCGPIPCNPQILSSITPELIVWHRHAMRRDAEAG